MLENKDGFLVSCIAALRKGTAILEVENNRPETIEKLQKVLDSAFGRLNPYNFIELQAYAVNDGYGLNTVTNEVVAYDKDEQGNFRQFSYKEKLPIDNRYRVQLELI